MRWFFLACLSAVLAPRGATQGPFAREAETRYAALFAEARDSAWRSGFDDERWQLRAQRLDALARALAAGAPASAETLAPVERALLEPHPNVRALALAAWREAGSVPLPPAAARALAQDLLPLVRLELARCLARVPCTALDDALGPLVLDADARVSAVARRALAARVDEAPRSVAAFVRAQTGSAGREALLRFALDLTRAHPSAAALERLAGESAQAGWPVALAAARLAGSGAQGGAADSDRDGAAAARALVASWEVLVREGWGTADERGALLAAAARSGDAALGHALVEGLRDMEDATHLDDAVRDELAEHFADAALRCRAPDALLAAGFELGLARGWALLLPTLSRRVSGWDPALGARIAVREPEGAFEAFVTTFGIRGDAGSAELLAAALTSRDEERRTRAFRVLASPAGLRRVPDELFSAWSALSAEERRRRLAWLPRDTPFHPLRAELLAMGERDPEQRRVAVELLAPFAGDAEVRERIESWLALDLEAFENAHDAGEAARERELWVQGELRALSHVDAEGAAEALADALARSTGRSTDIGKVAAAALASSEAGRLLLREALGRALDRRTRIEAAIRLVPRVEGAERAQLVELLSIDYPFAGWDLGVRMLAALGASGVERAVTCLDRVASDASVGPEQRIAAVDALAAHGSTTAVLALARAGRRAPDVETRASAIRALARGLSATDEVQAVALRVTEELTREVLAAYAHGAGSREGVDGWAHLREAVLTAWGQAAQAPPAALERDWLAPARAAAPHELEQRCAGADLPSPGFSWRGELAFARGVARADRLDVALAASAAWWTLDARLLFALAESAAGGQAGDADAPGSAALDTLVRAGLVGLLGEPQPDEAGLVRARSHLLAGAGRRGDQQLVERHAAALLAHWRAADASPRVWDECLGAFDRAGGVDPQGRLASAVWQARAWQALGVGALDEARRCASRAAARVGFSRAAAGAQERLAAALQRVRAGDEPGSIR